MDGKTKVFKWTRVMGILFLLLGILHVAATPLVIEADYSGRLHGVGMTSAVFMFVSTGAAVIFAGILTIYSSGGLARGEEWAWAVAFMSGIFMLMVGVGAVISLVILSPQFSPQAYITLILALLQLVPLMTFRGELTAKHSMQGI